MDILESFRLQHKLTAELILAIIQLDVYESPNIYPYLSEYEKSLPEVTTSAITRWKWNSAWSTQTIFEPLTKACLFANKTKTSEEPRWHVGRFYVENLEDQYPLPGIALLDKDGKMMDHGVTREIAILDGNFSTQSFDEPQDENRYNNLLFTADEKIASLNNLLADRWDPPPPESSAFQFRSLRFWRIPYEEEMDIYFVKTKMLPETAARIIVNSPIMQRYLYSLGGPVERAWHPIEGKALHAYAQRHFDRRQSQ